MKILIIEDQENLAKLIQKGLTCEGFLADYELDGEAGQKRINLYHEDYDLIILDFMLPKKNGLEILTETRGSGIATPILMLTAKDDKKDITAGLDAGADDYLTKPFAFE
jgi:DNA-binding response OmpR family regulator